MFWESRRRPSRATTVVALAVILVLGFAAQAHAATFTVGTTTDLTGNCPNPAAATCSLRQLINSEPAGSTIAVPAGTYDLTNGAIAITKDVSIAGAAARTTTVVQDSNTPDRVFDVQGQPGAPTVAVSRR